MGRFVGVGQGELRVVVVDDDPLYRRALIRASRGVELVLLADGQSALDYLANHRVDLAVVEMRMEGLDGIELCRRLCSEAQHVAPVLVTSHLTETYHSAALAAGAIYVRSKPYSLRGLISELPHRWNRRGVDELIASHLLLASNIAARFGRMYHDVLASEDIEALARLGLCEAAERYDRARAEPFLSYAETRISGAIMDELRRLGAHTRGCRELRRRIEHARTKLARGRRTVTPEAIAAHLGVSVEAVHQASSPTRIVLDTTTNEEARSSDPNVEQLVQMAELLGRLASAKGELGQLAGRVLEMHYGLDISFTAIARELHVKLADVQRAHDRALAQLRTRFGA